MGRMLANTTFFRGYMEELYVHVYAEAETQLERFQIASI
jgi:hypothetical protein